MITHPKVVESHLKRQAVIYIRQSSPLQVQQHQESQKRQYQLVERAQLLGWPAAQCVVIDEDLGLSGAHSANRPGYQRLIAMLALREIGIMPDLLGVNPDHPQRIENRFLKVLHGVIIQYRRGDNSEIREDIFQFG